MDHLFSRLHWRIALLVLAAALGYFVDVYDLLLFSVVRNASLKTLGVPDAESLTVGLRLLNIQMAGLLLGGFLWGMIGDKRGRLSVLFGSIVLYSIANFVNAFVTTIGQYEVCRFFAGIGLAGELGAGVALVSEIMSAHMRGIGTMVIAAVGLLGAVMAGIIGQTFAWQTAFMIGGVMGFVLLFLRIGAYESGLFAKVKSLGVSRGNLGKLFWPPTRLWKFILCILIALPAWYCIGILITGAPEFGTTLGLTQAPSAGTAVLVCYVALSVGDVACSGLSQLLRSRKLAFGIFHVISLLSIVIFLFLPPVTLFGFYARCALVGFGVGYWALFVTNAAEQFGTNLRASATTTVPNLVRGSLVLITAVFSALKPGYGLIGSAAIVGIGTVLIAFGSLFFTRERFGADLDFVEH